jgi:amino acid adenylation domain-containing protein
MDRSLEMLVAMIAVMKSGAAYVPLDPRFPAKRMQQILDETEVPILLTLSRHVEDLPEFGGTVLSLDSKANELAREPLRPLPPIAQQMRAYVIFTSGSTGKPKGVEVTHGAVVNLLVDVQRRIHMGPKDRLLAVTTLAFDISVLELLLPLISGGTVVIATQDDAADGLRLAELLVDSQITVLQATPFAWRMLLDVGFELPPGFKMLCGGEAWTPVMADKLLATGGRLWNMYGPTETTVWSSVTEMQRGEARITIGPPIANTRFYVLDERLEPLPPGVSGELFIAGLGLARGYFKRDDLTIEKFLPDPFVEDQRMYRTGDEVRQLPDGKIEFVGRLDHQVKLRGFRMSWAK